MGERKMPSNEDLEPTKARVVCTNREEEVAQIDIAFNQCINPLSIENNSILINGNPLPENAEIVFNRSGDTLSIKLSKDKLLNVSENVDGKEKIKIEVFNIQSFDGKISKEEVEAYF